MITVEQARQGLVKAIEDRGEDYVYNPADEGVCVYAYNGQPSCIVGYAIYTIDPIAFRSLSWEEKLAGGGGLGIGDVESVELEPLARKALTLAQVAQDRRKPWGEALAAFDAYVEGRTNDVLVSEVVV